MAKTCLALRLSTRASAGTTYWPARGGVWGKNRRGSAAKAGEVGGRVVGWVGKGVGGARHRFLTMFLGFPAQMLERMVVGRGVLGKRLVFGGCIFS